MRLWTWLKKLLTFSSVSGAESGPSRSTEPESSVTGVLGISAFIPAESAGERGARPASKESQATNPDSFSAYEAEAMLTGGIYPRTYSDSGRLLPVYPSMAMCGEAGEAAEKVKKAWRDKTGLDAKDFAKELGDVLWYVTAAAREVGYSLADVAELNLEKLRDRRARGTLMGAGDNR